MLLSEQTVKTKYQLGAKYYDLFVRIYPLIGLRMGIYRLRVVEFLRLKRGDCVVKLGCGTGLNFSRIVEWVGSSGRLIGVDLTLGMLACARDRVARAGWKNVELTQCSWLAFLVSWLSMTV